MKLSSYSRAGLFAVSTIAAVWAAGCSDDDEFIDGPVEEAGNGPTGTGGSTRGGATNRGGTAGSAGRAQGGTITGGGQATNGGTTDGGVAGSGKAGGDTNNGGSGVAGSGVAGGTTQPGGAPGSGGTQSAAGAGGTTAPLQAGTAGKSTSQGTAGQAGSSGAGCSTTASTLTSQSYTFEAGLNGFAKNAGVTSNSAAVFEQTTTSPTGGPVDLCTNGCMKIGGTFATGDGAYSKGIMIEKLFTASTNLVGAKIVAVVAIDNPNSTPIQFSMLAQGPAPTFAGWATASLANATSYTLASGTKAFEYVVVDVPNTSDPSKTFCAAAAGKFGFMLQTSAAITAANAGPVTVYVQSVTILGPGQVLGTGGAGGGGGAPGTAGATGDGTAGSAGDGTAGSTGDGTAGTAGAN